MIKRVAKTSTLILISLLPGCDNSGECDRFKEFLTKEVNGTVAEKFLDKNSNMRPTIFLDNSGVKSIEIQILIYIPEVYDTVDIGDKVFKDARSSKVKVEKKNRTIEFDKGVESWCPI